MTEEIFDVVNERDEVIAQNTRREVHARGLWPKAEEYPYDASAELSGMAAVDVLNVIRKAKSEANVSIKFAVTRVDVKGLVLQTWRVHALDRQPLRPQLHEPHPLTGPSVADLLHCLFHGSCLSSSQFTSGSEASVTVACLG